MNHASFAGRNSPRGGGAGTLRALAGVVVLGALLASGEAWGQTAQFSLMSLECAANTGRFSRPEPYTGPLGQQCSGVETLYTAEGSVWRFRVQLSQAVNAATSVDYTIVSYPIGTTFDGTSDDDFDTPITGTLSFAANQTMLDFNIRHGVDGGRENDEGYRVELSNPMGGPAVAACTLVQSQGRASGGCVHGGISRSEAIATRDLTITITGETDVAEGQVHTYTISTTPAPLSASQELIVQVVGSSSPGGSSASFADFEVRDSQGNPVRRSRSNHPILIYRAGSGGEFQIAFLRDTVADDAEGVLVRLPLSSPGFTSGAGLPLNITIADASPLENPQVSISGPQSAASEGGNATFTISVDRAISGNVTVAYAVSAIGVRPAQAADFGTGASATLPSGDIVINAGDNPSYTLNLAIYDDALRELTAETFRVTISNPRGQSAEIASAPHGSATADASIAPSEVPSITREFSLSAGTMTSVTEGDAATYTVSMSGPAPTQTLTITWTVTGTGATFTSNPASLSFTSADAANASKMFTVTPTEDTISDAPRTFTVTLNEPTGGDAVHGDFTGVNSVISTNLSDDDQLRAHFSAATISASEGGNAQFQVQLSAVSGATGSSQAVTISFSAADGSAALASDVNLPNPASITIEAANSLAALTGTFSVPIANDMLNEGAEDFTVTIDSVMGANSGVQASTPMHPTTATATIAASDPTRISGFRAPPANTVFEGDVAGFTVELSGGHITANVALPYAIDGTVEASDYDDVGRGRFIITPAAAAAARAADNPQPVMLRLRLADDGNADEPPETLRIALDGGAVSGGGGGGISTDSGVMPQQITIPEDVPRPTLRLHSPTPETQFDVNGFEIRFPVTLENPRPGVTVRADWAVSQQQSSFQDPPGPTAPPKSSFQSATGTVTLNPGERRKVIILRILSGDKIGGTQPFTLTLRNPQPANGADRTRIDPDDSTAMGALMEVNDARRDHRYRLAFTSVQVNEGGMTRVDMVVHQRHFSEDRFSPLLDVSYTLCIVHNAAENVRTRYSLGDLAAADDIRVTPTAQNPNGIGPVRRGNCNGFSGSTLVDVQIPRNSMRFSVMPSFTTSFLVHTVADAAAEGAETIWIIPFDNLIGAGSDFFSHEQLPNHVYNARSWRTSSVPDNVPNLPVTATINSNNAATRTFSLSGPATATESSGALQYQVSLSGSGLGTARTVNWQAVGSGANPVEAGDFSAALSGSFTFPAGTAAAQSFSLPAIVNDALNEPAEEFTVSFSMSGAGLNAEAARISTSSVTTTLAASDAVQVSLADAAQAAEGGVAQFNVNVSGGTRPGVLRVHWQVQSASTASVSVMDFRSGLHTLYPSGFIDLAVGQNNGAISIPTFDDGVEEQAENFQVAITAGPLEDTGGTPAWPQGAITVSRAQASGSIAASDLTVTVTLAPTSDVSEGAAGGAVFELRTDNLLDSDLVVTYTLSGTATRGAEYTRSDLAPGDSASQTYSVTRAAGDSAPTRIVFALPQDDVNEAGETIIMTLTGASIPGAPQRVQLGASGEIERTVTILDDDPISVRVTGNAADVAESLSARFTIEVSGGGSYTGAVMVPWEVVATAATGDTDAVAADFDFDDDNMADANYPSGTLSVPARGNAVLQIKIFADSDATETGETFALRIYGSDRSGGTAADGGGGGAIAAQNPSPLPTATILSATDAVRVAVNLSGPTEIAEGAGGTYQVTLSGITTPVANIVVGITVAADRESSTVDASGADFMGGSFPTPNNLTFTSSNWQTAQSFTVNSAGDTISEAAEVFLVSIAATGNGANGLSLGTTSLSARIADDDPLTISIADGSTEEGEPGDLPITISGGTPSAPLQVLFAAQGGTAEAAEYVLPQSPAQVAAAAASSGALRIATVEDGANEGSETVLLRLTGVQSPGGGVVTLEGEVASAPERNATLTITDDDPVLVSLSAVEANVAEDAGTADFAIALSGGTRSAPLTVDWSASGDAVFGEDWSGDDGGSLTIAPDANSATLALTLTDDSEEESDESLIVTLANPVGAAGAVSFSPATARVRILASDIMLSPGIRIDPPVCPSGGCAAGTTAMFPVTLRNPPPVDVTVNWRVHLDDNPSTADVTIHAQSTFSNDYVSDFTHDLIISDNPAGFYHGSIVFRAAQREQRKFIEIDLRYDTSREDARQEFYEVRISATPDSGANAVRVTTDRATSSIAMSQSLHYRQPWNVNVAFDRDTVSEGGRVVATVHVGRDAGSVSGQAGPIDGVAQICIVRNDIGRFWWATLRDGRAAGGAGDFRVLASHPRVIRIQENVLAPARAGGAGLRCTLVDVDLGGVEVGQSNGVPFTIEIFADGNQEPEEVLWVFVGERKRADHPKSTSGVEFRPGPNSSLVPAVLFQENIANAHRMSSLITIAASTANTRTLSLTGAASASEGGPALSFQVTPSAAFAASAAATWTVVGRGGNPASGDDFTATSGTITFPMGSTAAQSFMITAADDTLNEPTELFTVRVAMDDPTADGGTTGNSADGTITDNDAVSIRIRDVRRAPEGGAAVFPVAISGGERGGSLLVNWQVSGSGASAATAADFAGGAFPSGILRLPAGEASVPLNIPIAADSVADDLEEFTVTLTMPDTPGGADAEAWATGSVTLSDASATAVIGPYLSIVREFEVAVDSASIAEGGMVTFTVTLRGDAPESGSPATVDWTLTGSAGAADITSPAARSGTLSFTALGDQSVAVVTAADTLNEGDETLIFTLFNPADGANSAGLVPSLNAATATITDDAADAITLSVALASGQTDRDGTRTGHQVEEGDSVSFTVTLAGGELSGAAEIPFAVSGAAAGDFDISQPTGVGAEATGGVLRVGSGSSGTIALAISADNLNEALEELTVTLGANPSAPGAISVSSAQGANSESVEIRASNPVSLQISTAQTSRLEGADAVFSVTLSGASAGSAAVVTVPYTVSGDVTAADLGLSSLTGNSLEIPANTGVGELRIGIVQDGVAESAENLVVTLGASPSVATGGGAVARSSETAEQSATVTIPANAATVRDFAASVDFATRSEGQSAVFSVALTGTAPDSGAPATVTWTLSGVESADYTAPSAASGTLSFTAIGTQMITVNIAADNLNEAAETMLLTLSSPGGGGGGGTGIATAQASVQIAASNAATYRVVAVNPTQTTHSETSEALRARVELSSPSEGAVTIPFTIGGTATRGSSADYTTVLLSNMGVFSAEFAAGATSFEVVVNLREDALNEPDETIIITPLAEDQTGFSKGAAAGAITRAATHALTWTVDDDDDLTLSIRGGTSPVSEGGTAEFAIVAGGATLPAGRTAVLSYTLSGTGITADDLDNYSALSGTLNITQAGLDTAPAGQVALEIDITDDNAPEAAERLRVTLTRASIMGGGGVTASGNAEIEIAESDALTLAISRTDGDAFNEGGAGTLGTAVFTVAVTGGTPSEAVVVNFDVGGTGVTSGDYALVGTANPLRFSGASETITLMARADNLNEAAETLTVTLRDPSGGGGGLTPSLGTATASAEIPQNEPAQVSIARQSAATVVEGSPATFRVSIAPPSAAAVTLSWTAGVLSQTNTGTGDRAPNADGAAHEFSSAGGATRTSGGVGASGMVEIPAGRSSVDFTVTPAQDGREEDEETIRVTLGSTPQVGAGGGMVSSSGTAQVMVPANAASVRDFAVSRVGGASANEGETVVFRVALSGEAHTTTATVDWAVDGVDSSDWTSATARQLSYPVGATSRDIRIELSADNLNEAAEMLTVTLSMAAGGGGGGTGIETETASVAIAASDPITYAIGADVSRAEGDSGSVAVNFAVTMSGASAGSAGGAVRVPFSAASDSTATGADYTLSASPLTFPAGAGTQQITVMITGDMLSEAAETVVIELGAAETGMGAGVISPGRARAVLTITDDDNLSIRIARRSGESGDIPETGGVARFTVTVTGGTPTADIRAPFAVMGAVSAADYDLTMPSGIAATAEGGTLVLTAPALSGEIAVSASEDDFLEAREAFSLQLGAVSGGGGGLAIAEGGGSAGAAITDNESVTVSMARVGSGAIAEGGAGAQLRLTLTGGRLSAETRIPYTLSGVEATDISGDSAAGLSGLAGTVVIAASQSTSRTTMADFVLSAVADNLNEAAETLQVTLGSPTSQGEIAAAADPGDRASVEISASDPLTVSLAAPASDPVRETAVAVFGVSLAGASLGSEGPLTLSFNVVVSNQQDPANTAENPDVAVVGADGTDGVNTGAAGRVSATISIPAGATTAQIRLRARFDNLDEGDTPERLQVTLTGVAPDADTPGAGAASISGTAGSAGVDLENVNAARTLVVSAPQRVPEGQTIVFSVGLEGEPPLTAFPVDWTLVPAGATPPASGAGGLARNHGGAHPGDPDFSGALSGTVTFPVGMLAAQRVEVRTEQDPLNEGDEALSLRITPPSTEVGGRPAGFPDTAPATQVSVQEAQALIPANDPIVLSLVRSADDPDTLSNQDNFGFGVDFGCADGTSVAAGDCQPVVPTTVVTIPYTYMVGSSSFAGELMVPAGQTAAEANMEAGGTPVEPPAAALAAIRSATGTQDVSLELGMPTAAAPSVAPTGAGQPQPQTGLRSGQTAAEMRTAPVRVEKRLGEFSVALNLKRAEAPEGTTLELIATLRGSGALTGDLTIPWSTTLSAPAYVPGGAAAQTEDLVGPRSGSLRFASGAGSGATQRIAIEIATDDLEEIGGEYFTVTLGTPSGLDVSRLALDTTSTGVLIPALRATLSVSHATAAEGEDAVFQLSLDDFRGGDSTTRPVEVNYRLADGTATWGAAAGEGADYVAPQRTGTVTLPMGVTAGEIAGEIRIPLLLDGELEPRETFTLTLTSATGGGGNIIFPEMADELSATGTITDDADQARRRAKRVGTLVGVLNRSTAVLAADAIGARLERGLRDGGGPQSAQLSLAGRNLLGESERGRAASDLGLALYGAPGLGGAEAGLQGAGARTSAAAAFGGLGAGLAGGANMGRRTELPGLAETLRGSHFNFRVSWAEVQELAEGVEVWGSGGSSNLKGSPLQDGVRLSYDGDNHAFFLGADRPVLDNLLAGVALGWASGDLNFTDRTENGRFELRGSLQNNTLGLYPYVGWWLAPNVNTWLVLGIGSGSVDVDESEDGAGGGAAVHRTLPGNLDSTMWMLAAGLTGRVQLASSTELKLGFELSRVRSYVAAGRFTDGAEMPSVRARSLRVAGEAEVGHRFALPGGLGLRPFVSTRWRLDAGAAVEQDHTGGNGMRSMDVGGGAEADWPQYGLALQLRGAKQLSDTGHEEQHLAVDLSYDLGSDGVGMALTLNSALSGSRTGTANSADGGLFAGRESSASFGSASSLGGAALGGAAGSLLASTSTHGLGGEIAYGMPLRAFGAEALLTPYATFDWSGNARRYETGLRLLRGRHLNLGLGLKLDQEAATPNAELLFTGQLNF